MHICAKCSIKVPWKEYGKQSCSCLLAFLILLWFILFVSSCTLVHLLLQRCYICCVSDEKIALLGAIQSLFEGSMYTFVFLWTPALSPNDEEIPHGFIFATFMLSSMLGSSIASKLMARSSFRVESYMQIVFAVSSASLLLPILTTVRYSSNILSFHPLSTVIYISRYSDIFWLGYCGTVFCSSYQSKRRQSLIRRVHSASWLLYLWKLCWHILAIHYEDEIPIHSRGSQEHHHELFPHSSEHFCVCCAVQCKLHNLWLKYNAWSSM